MPTLAGLVLPPPRSWDEFEEIALSAAKLRWNSTDLYRHGRQGQRQDGVDLFGHAADGRHIGVQGKNTVDGIPVATIKSEIAQAETFRPPIDALYIATTAKRDVASPTARGCGLFILLIPIFATYDSPAGVSRLADL